MIAVRRNDATDLDVSNVTGPERIEPVTPGGGHEL
jgi:hypothetical protein